MNFKLKILERFERVLQEQKWLARDTVYYHNVNADWIENWSQATLHQKFPLGMITLVLILIFEMHCVEGAGLSLSRDKSTDRAHHVVRQVYSWK